MSYTAKDVRDMKRRIRAEFPDVLIDCFDYDFGLRVAKPDLSAEIICFQPQRDDIGQPEVVTPYEQVAAFLRG